MLRAWIATVAALFITSHTANAATITSLAPNKENKVIINLVGEIALGDRDALATEIKNTNALGRIVSGVRLNSPGGSLAEGMSLAQLVRTARISTSVPATARCASACFLVFAAGEAKYVNYSAEVGVHGASLRGGGESAEGTVLMARYVKELGVPEAIIGKMVITPASEMVWLSVDDLKSMGSTMVGKPDQLARPGPPRNLQPEEQTRALESNSRAATPAALDKDTSWKLLVDKAGDLSAASNNGRIRAGRSCEPRTRTCNRWITFPFKDTIGFVKTTEDSNGKLLKRELCTLNSDADIRDCLNWDTNETKKDMKDSKGDWYNID